MGVIAINMAMKSDVKQVLVVEKSRAIYNAFMKSCYPNLPEHIRKVLDQKMDILYGDITEMDIPLEEIDFLYVDIWEQVGDMNTMPDMMKILEVNKGITIHSLYWWGMEYDIISFCSHSDRIMLGVGEGPVVEKYRNSQRIAIERFFSYFNDPVYKNIRIDLNFDELDPKFINILHVSTPFCLHAFTKYLRRKSGREDIEILCKWEERYVHGMEIFHPIIHEYMALLALWIMTTKVVLCHSLSLDTIFKETREGLM